MITTHITERGEVEFIVDGIVVERVRRFSRTRDELLAFSLREEEAIKAVMARRFSEIPKEIGALGLKRGLGPTPTPDAEVYLRVRRAKSGGMDVQINCSFDSNNWKHLWSVNEYMAECTRAVASEGRFKPYADAWSGGLLAPAFTVTSPVEDAEAIVEAEFLKHISALSALHELVEASLRSKLHNESVVMYFDFPEEVKEPCEQYLIYFVRFLKDLGVEATAELRHEAGQVLFAVTPADKQEALDNIRAALETYLSLPMGNLSGGESDISAQRLAANVYHLKSQLTLAQAVLQAKDATIQAQQFTIEQQQRLLSGEVFLDSLKNVTPKPEGADREELLGGTVAITKYEGKGFEVNLPELFRKFRRVFSKDEKDN